LNNSRTFDEELGLINENEKKDFREYSTFENFEKMIIRYESQEEEIIYLKNEV
jgi:hypothetical protein